MYLAYLSFTFMPSEPLTSYFCKTLHYKWLPVFFSCSNDILPSCQDYSLPIKLINHNYNKIVKSDWLSTALISALIGQFNKTVRVMPK